MTTPIVVPEALLAIQEAAKISQYNRLCAQYGMISKYHAPVPPPPPTSAVEEDTQSFTDLESDDYPLEDAVDVVLQHPDDSIFQQDAADVLQHGAADVLQHGARDIFGTAIPPHQQLDFYGRRMCRSPSPPQAPVKRYRYGSYIVEGRRLPKGGFQALSWISGPGISSSSMSL